MERAARRDTTAIVYTRPPTPKGWGWRSQAECTAILQEQENDCRDYAKGAGLEVAEVVIAPYDAPPLDASFMHGVGHIIVADCELLPSMEPIAELCVTAGVHLHDARSGTSVTNWRPPVDR